MKLENEFFRVEIDPQHGLIRSLLDKVGKLELISESALAGNFRLLLPLPDLQANYISGSDQILASAEEAPHGLALHWRGPLTCARGAFDLDVSMHLEMMGQALRFRLDVRNHTSFKVAEVWYPILGGILGIGERSDTRVMIPMGGGSWDQNLLQRFHGMTELGTPVPECFFIYPGNMPMPWMDLYNRRLNRGAYIGCHDVVPRFKVLRLEMQPGIGHLRQDPWPRPSELADGLKSGIVLSWVGFPYTPPGEIFQGPPVVVQFHQGDWHDAAPIYRRWFTSQFSLSDPAKDWMRQEPAFQNAMCLLPEGNVNMAFKDLPQWAHDALDYGVTSVLVSGWDRGGHDSHYPFYEPDSRLGSWEDLAAAVAEIHRLGMKVFFFVNLQPVDCDTDWYREELHRYRSMDLWGCSMPMGFGMGTLGARMGMTRRSMVFASPSFPELRSVVVRQMVKLAEIGADGLHIDKLAWAGINVNLDFNPTLKASPDRASWEGVLRGVEEILQACRAVNPDFSVSYEGAWDRLLQHSNVTWMWHSTWTNDHTAAFRYTFPQWLATMAVTQPFDYNVVNNAVRFGYQLFVGPAHYTRSMQDGPMKGLSAYIKEMLRLIAELKDIIFHGDFLDTLQVRVKAHEEIKFSTHRNPATGRRACVLVNFGTAPQEAVLSFEGNKRGKALLYEPFQKTRSMRLPVTLRIPAERLVIVVEEEVVKEERAADAGQR